MVISSMLARLLAKFLYGISRTDWIAYASTATIGLRLLWRLSPAVTPRGKGAADGSAALGVNYGSK